MTSEELKKERDVLIKEVKDRLKEKNKLPNKKLQEFTIRSYTKEAMSDFFEDWYKERNNGKI